MTESFFVVLELRMSWSIQADNEDEALQKAKDIYYSNVDEALNLSNEEWEVD